MKTKKQIFVIIFKMVAILFLSTISNSSFAGFPPIQWNGCYGGFTPGGLSNIDNGFCIQQTSDGGYIAIGTTNSTDGNAVGGGYHGILPTKDVWVLRLDSLGNIIWQKCYGGTGDDDGRFIIQTKDGGFIFVATTNSNDFDVSGLHVSGTTTDAWVVKLTTTGIITWQKCLGGTGDETARCILQSFDSSYVISGQTNSNDFDVSGLHVSGTTTDAWVVKLTTTGIITWQKCLGGTGDETALSIIQAKDSNYVFAGSTNSINNGNIVGYHSGTIGSFDFLVIKLSKINGNIIAWSTGTNCFGGTADDRAFSIKQTFSGGYVINGYTSSTNGDITGSNSRLLRNVWFIKIGSTGNLQFQQRYGGPNSDEGSCVIQTADSGFVLANLTSSNLTDDVVGPNNGPGKSDVWLVKLDSSGFIKHEKCYGTTQAETPPCVVQTRDKGFIFITIIPTGGVGGVNPYQYKGTTDIWIVKLMDPLPPLPIELISFKAKTMKDKVELYWSTVSEINNNYFSIEKSIDGYNYQEIGQVSGAGNSSQTLNYSFFDDNPFHGVAYYRLSQTDYNGDNETFPPIAIEFTDDKQVVKTILYDTQGREVVDMNTLSSGIYILVSYDKEGNILERNKLFK